MNRFDKALLESIVVLYIEDDGVSRAKTSNSIRDMVGKLHTGKTGLEGLEKFEKYKPHLIVTDLIMPDMTGIELAKEIRARGFDTPVIITSALDDTKSILETVDLGIDKYILKPINTDELVSSILRVAKKRITFETEKYIKKGGFLIDAEKRKSVEMIIRSMTTNYLKQLTGKGPRKVEVSILDRCIKIKVIDCLTQMEKKMIEYGYNYSMIDFNRDYLYRAAQEEMEKSLSDLCNMKMVLKNMETNSEAGFDMFVFSF